MRSLQVAPTPNPDFARRVAWTTEGPLISTQFEMLDGRQWKVEMLWSVDSGRLEPVSVSVEGEFVEGKGDTPVRADVLRRLPVGTLQRTARRHADRTSERFKSLKSMSPDWLPPTSVVELMDKLGRAHRGVATTPGELEQIAAVYLGAWREGEPVTKAVADAFCVALSTAGKRIMKARKAGLLP